MDLNFVALLCKTTEKKGVEALVSVSDETGLSGSIEMINLLR